MISASVYITVCSAKNRLRRRLQRLREPRYLIGAIVGAAYIYFSFFARARGRRARGRPPQAAAAGLAAIAAAAPPLVGAGLLVLALVAWLLPFESGLLDFTGAETDLLFSAPITRRQLLLHRVLRSQIGILFGAAIVAIASPAGGWMRVRISVATWLLLLTIRIYFTAVTLSRKRGRASWVPLGALVAAFVVVAVSFARALAASPVAGAADAGRRFVAAVTHGPAQIALWPFVALARPFLATTAEDLLRALAAGALVLAATAAWMLHSDEAFLEAAADAAARRVEKTQSRRGGAIRLRATGLSLALTGRPEHAFFWKNGVQTVRLTGLAAIRVVVGVLAVSVATTSFVLNTMHLRGVAAAACAIGIGIAGFAAVIGPQVVRTDLRGDLMHLEMLKTWPVRAAAVIRGEIAWPGAMLTVVGWAAVAGAALFSPAAFPRLLPATRASFAAAACLVMPALVFAQYLVQNAAALAFPAWVPLGNQRPRGVDAMGQRLIMFGGVLLSVALLMIPGVIAGGAIWFALVRWTGDVAMIPAAAACTAIVLVEILAATELLAPLYERLDLLSIEHSE